ncbi:hypothetical protein SAMN05216404_10651 [Nitrosospira multiformis]|uniref:Uncharacterized protein n=2 Tax=Nitrosospira multiformis TaxID=1231 RepID=A0A1H8IEU0_9PROT|nr:hypothetical protein SAMN05216404_10651 [Nitrosospira multiformis]
MFVGAALLVLAVVPAINLNARIWQKNDGQEWWSESVLYNFDFALPFLSRFLYPHDLD